MGSQRDSQPKCGGWALPIGRYVGARPRRKEWPHGAKCEFETSTEQPETAWPFQAPAAPQDHLEVTPETGTKASVKSEKDCLRPGSPGTATLEGRVGTSSESKCPIRLTAEPPWLEEPKQVPTQEPNPQGPTPVRLHAVRKQWLISLALCATMPTLSGPKDQVPEMDSIQLGVTPKATQGYCPLFSHSGMQKETQNENRRDAGQTGLRNNK